QTSAAVARAIKQTTLPVNVDRARPGARAILLRHANVDRVVAGGSKWNLAREAEGPVRIVARQAEHPHKPRQLAGVVEHEVLQPDAGDRLLERDQRRFELQRSGIGILQNSLEAAEITGGQR